MSQVLLSGNEAIAQGAWEAGAAIGVGYPGTPSTETLERFAKLPEVYAEWAPNEKVALEVAAGASLGGKRVLVTMKHVGLNVAADPLFTLAYTGVGAGMVILVADDPGMHSSQNEQDSHNYAAFARIPMLEPSDSAEALEFTKLAFRLSEQFDTPVFVRSTVRISHAKSMVTVGERVDSAPAEEYRSDPAKWVMMPAMARARRLELDQRIENLTTWADAADIVRVESGAHTVGIVCAGASYQYVREAAPDVSVLKLGITYPLPETAIRAFADSVERLVVAEEADDYLKRSIRALGIHVDEFGIPRAGELSPDAIGGALGREAIATRKAVDGLPPRPPLMCPGCPHRLVFNALRKVRAIVTGDIGCYTLGALKPLGAMDTCVDMGASIGMAHGMELAGASSDRPVVGVIGDSTFTHSGITGVLNTVYNGGGGTILILDNRITAMTGHQGNPVNGITIQGRPSRELNLETVLTALGVSRVRTIDSQDAKAVEAAIREETAELELSVLVMRSPCALLVREKREPYMVEFTSCTGCHLCVRIGCPAIGRDEESGRAVIDVSICEGCGQCVQICRTGAIVLAGPACTTSGGNR